MALCATRRNSASASLAAQRGAPAGEPGSTLPRGLAEHGFKDPGRVELVAVEGVELAKVVRERAQRGALLSRNYRKVDRVEVLST